MNYRLWSKDHSLEFQDNLSLTEDWYSLHSFSRSFHELQELQLSRRCSRNLEFSPSGRSQHGHNDEQPFKRGGKHQTLSDSNLWVSLFRITDWMEQLSRCQMGSKVLIRVSKNSRCYWRSNDEECYKLLRLNSPRRLKFGELVVM